MKRGMSIISALISVIMVALCLTTSVFAVEHTGVDGMEGIQPDDTIILPDNTDEATLTAQWGVRVIFKNFDDAEIKNEVVPVTEAAPGTVSLPEDPVRSGYTFEKWKRGDTMGSTATINDDGTVSGITGPGPVVFVAQYVEDSKPPVDGMGNLTIRAEVSGSGADVNREFTFTLTLNSDSSFSYSGSKSGKIKSGDSLSLKHGESVTISGIPAGVDYSVEESDNDGYSLTASGDQGTISNGLTALAIFKNEKDDENSVDSALSSESSSNSSSQIESSPSQEGSSASSAPRTGDGNSIIIYLVFMLASALVIIVVCLVKKLNAYKHNQ